MSALTKAEITQTLCTELEIEKKLARDILDEFFDEITKTLVKGEAVKISGFGNFEVRKKPARPGRNPKTGQEVTVEARRVVVFKAGLKLKRRVID